jgi:hypothetical protein
VDRTTFSLRLGDALAVARDFGQQFIAEELPGAMLCRVLLNQSHDHGIRSGEVAYPDERSPDELLEVTEVVDLLWRSESVPEWIDVRVSEVREGVTTVELLVCGRFTSKDDLLYHRQEGRPPFHVTSPTLPPGYKDGERFSLSQVRSRRTPA